MLTAPHLIQKTLLAMAVAFCILAIAKPVYAQTEPIKLSSGASGGTFFDYGIGIAKLIESKSGLKIEVQPSGGSIENLKKIDAGATDLGLVAMGPAFEAWTASAAPWLGAAPLKRERALFPMYETPFHLATITSSGVKTIRDLDGKKVGVGPKSGANEIIFAKLAEGLGIKPELVFGDPGELADEVISGDITATFFGAGAPIPAYRKIASMAAIQFIPLDGEAGAVLQKAFPYLTLGAIPAKSYDGQDEAVSTVVLWNFVVAREGLSTEAAYAIVKAIMSDPAAVKKIHPAASATVLSNVAANTFMTFHAGALRYYDEAKINIPRELR